MFTCSSEVCGVVLSGAVAAHDVDVGHVGVVEVPCDWSPRGEGAETSVLRQYDHFNALAVAAAKQREEPLREGDARGR